MTDQNLSKVIEEYPIGNGLDAFCASFSLSCEDRGVPVSPEALDRLDPQVKLVLLSSLQTLPAARHLRSKMGHGMLRNDLLKLMPAVASGEFDSHRILPLLNAILNKKPDNEIWYQVYNAVIESTPPPRTAVASLQQTPWSQNMSGFVNSSEYRQDVDRILKSELGPLYIGVPAFHETFFGCVPHLKTVSEAVFHKCIEGENPLFGSEGWSGWPIGAKESEVLKWFASLTPKLEAFADNRNLISTHQRQLLAQPTTPLPGSIGKRSIDIGFVDNKSACNEPNSGEEFKYHWSHILVPGELKSNPAADIASIAWISLVTYTREVLATQDTRRFVLGFTLCGSLMRVWEFDRLGAIASEQFDINKHGLQFVTTILGFLCMSKTELGFDPTITTSGSEQYIEIERNGSKERLIIDRVIRRSRCIAGRATMCWKAHCEKDPSTPLIIKDLWQYIERAKEGELLREATEKGVHNIARYYHHETVHIGTANNDVLSGIRKGLEVPKATRYPKYPLDRSKPKPSASASASASAVGIPRQGRSGSAGVKRPPSESGVALPPSKRSCSASPAIDGVDILANRVHRRIILRDYGKPIYKASSRIALLTALKGCIEGHESLTKAGILHRDISVNNLMINEDHMNPSYLAFLIDLDLAIRVQREHASGAKGKTGTRAFMAIGALLGEEHSFMHDLESFFWVLFWICIHYDGPDKDVGPTEFNSWNYESDDRLVRSKTGTIASEGIFLRTAQVNFTPYYQSLVPWVNRLRRRVFPNGVVCKIPNQGLYSSMKDILKEAQTDINVIGPTPMRSQLTTIGHCRNL